jgi:hypothetical protein
MPEAFTTWRCDTCHKDRGTYEAAEKCESDHIINAVTDKFKADIKRITGGRNRDR